MAVSGSAIGASAASVVGLAVFVAAIFGMTSCVERDWAHQDACRREGGALMKSYQVMPGINGDDVCAKIVQPAVIQTIPLPSYRR